MAGPPIHAHSRSLSLLPVSLNFPLSVCLSLTLSFSFIYKVRGLLDSILPIEGSSLCSILWVSLRSMKCFYVSVVISGPFFFLSDFLKTNPQISFTDLGDIRAQSSALSTKLNWNATEDIKDKVPPISVNIYQEKKKDTR